MNGYIPCKKLLSQPVKPTALSYPGSRTSNQLLPSHLLFSYRNGQVWYRYNTESHDPLPIKPEFSFHGQLLRSRIIFVAWYRSNPGRYGTCTHRTALCFLAITKLILVKNPPYVQLPLAVSNPLKLRSDLAQPNNRHGLYLGNEN